MGGNWAVGWLHVPLGDSLGRSQDYGCLAGEEGLEPSHAGIKIRCLDQLGDSPTPVAGPNCGPATFNCRLGPSR